MRMILEGNGRLIVVVYVCALKKKLLFFCSFVASQFCFVVSMWFTDLNQLDDPLT